MANGSSEWLRHFLQAGILQEPELQSPAHDAPAPSSGYHPDMGFGVPSPYQALMNMTNNNPSHYFQQRPHPGHGLTPEQAERFALAAMQRSHAQPMPHLPNPTSTSQRPSMPATIAPSALLKYPQPPMALTEPTQQHSDTQVHSDQQLPRPFPSGLRPAMPSNITSSERETLSQHQQPRDAPAPAAHGASDMTRLAARPNHRTLQGPALATPHHHLNTYRPSRASPTRVSQHPRNQTQPAQQGWMSSPQPSSAPPVPAGHLPSYRARPTQQGQIVSYQASRASQAPANQHSNHPTRPMQQHTPLGRRKTPLATAHPPGQISSQPPRASSTDQHGKEPTYSVPKPAIVSALQRPPMAAPSGRPNASQSPVAVPSPGQQNPDDADHVPKKRRMDDRSSDARPRPELQQSGTIPQPQFKSVLPSQLPQPKSAPQPQYRSDSQKAKTHIPGSLSAFSYSSPNKSSLRDRMEMVSTFSSLDAAQKAEYDPKTIARDVLIASGRHPTEPSLNHHLFRLRDLFNGVTFLSDLTTFRWDIAEAAAREREAVASSRPPAPQQPQQNHAESQLKSSVPGPTPQLRPLNSIGKPSWPGNNPDAQRPPANLATSSRPQQPLANLPIQTREETAPNHTPSAHLPRQAQAANTPKSTPTINLPKQTPPIDLIERTHPASPLMQIPAVQAPKQTPTANKRQHAVAVSIPKQKAAEDSPKQAVAASSSKRTTSKSQGPKMVGKKQQSMVEVSIPAVSVSYPVFACKWKNCQAKLHNLDVLKQHLMKIHVPHHITCGWAECQLEAGLPAAKLYEHILKQHVEPIAWKLGDGPTIQKPGESASNDYVMHVD